MVAFMPPCIEDEEVPGLFDGIIQSSNLQLNCSMPLGFLAKFLLPSLPVQKSIVQEDLEEEPQIEATRQVSHHGGGCGFICSRLLLGALCCCHPISHTVSGCSVMSLHWGMMA